jgi:hypothetical protein
MLPCGEMLITFVGLRLGGKFEVNVEMCKTKILLFLDASRFPEKHRFYWKVLRLRPIVLTGAA